MSKTKEILKDARFNADGLIPAIVQDVRTREVLTVARRGHQGDNKQGELETFKHDTKSKEYFFIIQLFNDMRMGHFCRLRRRWDRQKNPA
jgi:phosphoribosyl-AMP cyclohydrolase